MLKWAVTGSNRQSNQHRASVSRTSGQIANNSEPRRSLSNVSASCTSKNNRPNRLRRKSTGHEITNIRRKVIQRDKENLTSTPLPLTTHAMSPLRRLDSLKDLSNIAITPTKSLVSPYQTPKNSKPPDKSSQSSTAVKNNPSQYATTLPTFDVEYSPCGVIPGPILALRGVGIADSYFEKPRYLSDEIPESEKKSISASPLSKQLSDFSFARPKQSTVPNNNNIIDTNEEESLSSSRMGDITLDRMIDAILESARKERRPVKSKQSTFHTMSPTYTPADDPASDLNEIWDPRSAKYLQSDKKRKDLHGYPINVFNEREVRVKTPENLDKLFKNCPETPTVVDDSEISCHLQRQKAVRRKRRLSITSTVKHSAQKLFTNNSFLRRNLDQLAEIDTAKGCCNISPDSGRNSASDLEESTDDGNNVTKRRLLFSPVKGKVNKDKF